MGVGSYELTPFLIKLYIDINNVSYTFVLMNVQKRDYTKQINKVIDYIYSNLNRLITIEELSAEIDLSTYHFHRIISVIVGEPIGKYILRRRLERAANTLFSDNAPVKDIAYDWGFSSVS